MTLFNIISEICSIIGLLFSIYVTYRTGKISKLINTSLSKERFRINYQNIMDNLKSYGFNIIREDFEISNQFLCEFIAELHKYKKSYKNILHNDELLDIEHLIELLSQTPLNRSQVSLALSKIISKPKYDSEE